MRHPWQAAVQRLRTRAVLSGVAGSFGRWAIPLVPLYAIYVIWLSRLSPWLAVAVPWVGGLVLLALVVAAIRGVFRAGHSDEYLAKWIDLTNKLDDRLTSAVEWARLPQPDAFQLRCMEELTLAIGSGQAKLTLPRTRPRNLIPALLCLPALGALGVMLAHRPAPVFEANAKEKVALPATVAAQARQLAGGLKAPAGGASASADPELDRLAREVETVLRDVESGRLDRETSLARVASLVKEVEKARGGLPGALAPAGSASSGPVGALARAVASGDAAAVKASLDAVGQALATGGLDEAQAVEARASLLTLAALAEGKDPALGSRLREAARLLEADAQAQAAKALQPALASGGAQLKALDEPLGRLAAASRVQKLADLLERSLDAETGGAHGDPTNPNGPATAAGANKGGDPKGTTGGAQLANRTPGGTNGAGAAATDLNLNPERPGAANGSDVTISGVWSGKAYRQLFDTSSANAGPDAATQKLLTAHERVVEDRFRRDEIPPEYQDAVRTYFAAIHQRASAWTQTRK